MVFVVFFSTALALLKLSHHLLTQNGMT